MLFIDLDDFKVINDTLGHAAGDRLLVAVGERLRSVVRASDLAARLGGDEFAALLWDTPDLSGSLRVAERLTMAMSPPFELGGQPRSPFGPASASPADDRHRHRRRPAPERGRGHVLGQGPRQGPGRRLRAIDARGGARACRALGGPRARITNQRVRPPVPADRRDRDRPDDRRRGARALEAPDARPDRTRRLHPPRRGVRRDPRHRPVGARARPAPRRANGAPWTASRAVHGQHQRLGPAARPAGVRRGRHRARSATPAPSRARSCSR